MAQWIHSHETALLWLTALSIITFFVTLIIVPLIVVRIPFDYFVAGRHHREPWADRHTVLRAIFLLIKNLFGFIFVISGILMLVLPGQGMLTILIGIMLLDFPGKYKFERWIIMRRPLLHSINWVRRCAGRAPLVLKE